LETIIEAGVDILGKIPWKDASFEEKVQALNEMWKEGEQIKKLLEESTDLEEARKKIYDYLASLEWELRVGRIKLHRIDYWLALEAIKNFRNIISPENEKIATFSTLEYLWRLAKEGERLLNKVSMGFILEFKYLFKAIHGNSNYAKGWIHDLLGEEKAKIVHEFLRIGGREGAILRSEYLDEVAKLVKQYFGRYTFGLDPKVIEKREQNIQKILDYFGATRDDWMDYKWHFKHVFKKLEHVDMLKELVPLTEEDVENIKMAIENRIPFGITPYYLHLLDFERADRKWDPQVRAQVIPPRWYLEEMIKHRQDRNYVFDFMKEHDTSPLELVTRRYPMIAILKVADTCPQICVYCQRNWEIEEAFSPVGIPPKALIDKAIEWFANHESMMDVLLTGGDPAILNDKYMEYILSRLAEIDHIKSIRIGSRIVVTVPMRITKEYAEMLSSFIEPNKRNVMFVTHVESAEEVTPYMAKAVKTLRDHDIYVYNQQVYQFATSRRFQYVLTRIALKIIGIDPYYNFYPKGKFEQRDFLVPVARLAQERKEEARLLPGQYRTDEPVFNVPALGKNHIRAWQDRELIAIMPETGSRIYVWHPWEKGVAPVDPWPYVDVPIYDYLMRLKEVGEDIKEYESIWYYY